jgi:hypothetical protein
MLYAQYLLLIRDTLFFERVSTEYVVGKICVIAESLRSAAHTHTHTHTHITVEVIFRKSGGFFFKENSYFFVIIAQCVGFFQVYWIVCTKYWILAEILHSEKPHTYTQDSSSFFPRIVMPKNCHSHTHTHTHRHIHTHTHSHTHTQSHTHTVTHKHTHIHTHKHTHTHTRHSHNLLYSILRVLGSQLY